MINLEYNPIFKTKLGQLYKGDCLDVMEYLINQNIKVDAIITDPPYEVTGFAWDKAIPFDKMWERLNALIKDDGAIVLFGNEPFSSDLRNSNKDMYKYDWKWLKTQVTGFQNAKHQPLRCYEDIMVFSKGSAVTNGKVFMRYYPQGLYNTNLKVRKKDVIYLREKKDTDKKEQVYMQEFSNFPRNVIQFQREAYTVHPTQKPCDLMEYLVKTYTKEGDIVLDFTCGSGSTLLACEILNRRWIGIELTQKYCEVTKNRITKGIQLKFSFESKEV